MSSFLALAWLNVLSILAIPVYIKLLGVTEWGIVAACSSLQLLFTFIDLGFSQIVPRWIAREADSADLLRRHIRVFQKIYAALALGGFLLLQFSANFLAYKWFNVAAAKAPELEFCIRLISFQLLFQFSNNLYVGIWHGLQLQVQANLRTCLFGTLKHALAIAALAFLTASPPVYAGTFGVVAFAELSFSILVTYRKGLLSGLDDSQIEMAPFLREAAVLSIGVLVGLGVSQLDRMVLSRSVSIDEFGVYVVVANLAMAFLALQAPLTRAYFPVLVQDIKDTGKANPQTLKRLLIGNTLICVIPALVACWAADRLLGLWVHNAHFVEVGTMPLRLLLVAASMNAIYNCFYQVIVAQGSAHVVLKFNLACFAVGIATVVAAGMPATLVVGGLIWVSTTLTQLILGVSWYVISARSAQTALLPSGNVTLGAGH